MVEKSDEEKLWELRGIEKAIDRLEVIEERMARIERDGRDSKAMLTQMHLVLIGDAAASPPIPGMRGEHIMLMDERKVMTSKSRKFWGAVQFSVIGIFITALGGAALWVLARALKPIVQLINKN